MSRCILYIYDKFKQLPLLGWLSIAFLTACCVALILHLTYKEDISDFLPLDEENQTAFSIYQDISGANKIFGIISLKNGEEDPDQLIEGIDRFAENVESLDSLQFFNEIMKEIDFENVFAATDFVYENIPYFLDSNDYDRIDSLLSIPGYIESKLEEDKQMLLFPSSNMIARNITRDPLNLFSSVNSRLQQAGLSINFNTYDGHILSPEGDKAILILESGYGAQESENNAKLVDLLNKAKSKTEDGNPNLDIHIIGGPVIAVGNANRIKKDSILAVSISGILILFLLIYVFRNLWNILLIVVSIAWGWLFAMAGISLFYDSISLIVLGITSVILGIAVNYPLHLIDHIKEHPNPRNALKEIVAPLVVGNITTVGAFLCLVPLNSPALHDLGLFSSLLLVGTILFVLFFLPHIVKIRKPVNVGHTHNSILSRFTNLKLENSKYLVSGVLLLTLLFAFFSFKTEFDSDIRNINYLTTEQRENLNYFQSLITSDEDNEELFVVSFGDTWDEALKENEKIGYKIDSINSVGLAKNRNHSHSFLVSTDSQITKLRNWNDFLNRHSQELRTNLPALAEKSGFNMEAFSPFYDILDENYEIKKFEHFKEFINTLFQGTLSEDNKIGKKSVVRTLNMNSSNIDKVKAELSKHEFGGLFFDVKSMNGSIANSLSDDFNYIGFACGAIVFIFLWISLGSIELALISFTPMAISWVWILGFMGMAGIKFNIVNIILATFIFGQGDDYTIFITEGLTYEFAYGRKVLASYKNSITVSALIMFFGIGTLLFAKHPAMQSLGEVTVIGMFSVVLMAYLFPPLIFNWLTKKNGKLRPHPYTLKILLRKIFIRKDRFCFESIGTVHTVKNALPWVSGRYLYKGREITLNSNKILRSLSAYSDLIESLHGNKNLIVIDNAGEGELALMLALIYPETTIYCSIPDSDARDILKGSASDFVSNIIIFDDNISESYITLELKKDDYSGKLLLDKL